MGADLVGTPSEDAGSSTSQTPVGRQAETTCAVGDRYRIRGRVAEVTDVAPLSSGHEQVVLRWVDDARRPPLSLLASDLGEFEHLV